MRGTIAKMLRRAVRSAPATIVMQYTTKKDPAGLLPTQRLPLTFRYPSNSFQAEYKSLKRLVHTPSR
jgi:hypothetical protein